MKIGIIGGGPAGMMAAIQASKSSANITLFDNNNFLGRKLSATGAGRCNLTNMNVVVDAYRSVKKFAFTDIIRKYDYKFLAKVFIDLGIFTYHTDDGWVYPISNSAKNIANHFEEILRKQAINLRLNTTIEKIKKSKYQYQLFTSENQLEHFDRVILATGGRANPQLNANDQLLFKLKDLGHKIIPPNPALSPIITTKKYTKFLNGVRCDALVQFKNNGKIIKENIGNIIFTEWGVNGPGVMNLSHLFHEYQDDLNLVLRFQETFPNNFLEEVIKNNSQFNFLFSPLLSVLNKKIIDQIFLNLHLDLSNKFSVEKFKELFNNLQIQEKIIGTKGFEVSQISTGAVDSEQVNSSTLESQLCPGLFFAGEVLDVFGPCGGYNLHWAFISGYVAGNSVISTSE